MNPEDPTAKRNVPLAGLNDSHSNHHTHSHKEEKFEKKTFIKDTISILVGIAFATIGLELFVVPNQLLDGGVTGISLLLAFILKLDVSIFIFVINMPFVYMGYKQVGKLFAAKTFLAIITLSVVLWFLHSIHLRAVTEDKVLIAVFGGICLGAGIGFAIKSGSIFVVPAGKVFAVEKGFETGFKFEGVVALKQWQAKGTEKQGCVHGGILLGWFNSKYKPNNTIAGEGCPRMAWRRLQSMWMGNNYNARE